MRALANGANLFPGGYTQFCPRNKFKYVAIVPKIKQIFIKSNVPIHSSKQ